MNGRKQEEAQATAQIDQHSLARRGAGGKGRRWIGLGEGEFKPAKAKAGEAASAAVDSNVLQPKRTTEQILGGRQAPRSGSEGRDAATRCDAVRCGAVRLCCFQRCGVSSKGRAGPIGEPSQANFETRDEPKSAPSTCILAVS